MFGAALLPWGGVAAAMGGPRAAARLWAWSMEAIWLMGMRLWSLSLMRWGEARGVVREEGCGGEEGMYGVERKVLGGSKLEMEVEMEFCVVCRVVCFVSIFSFRSFFFFLAVGVVVVVAFAVVVSVYII